MPKSESFRGASFKVAVEGIPVNIPLSDVQRTLSKYGEIVLSEMKQDNFGAYCATLEFKVTKFPYFKYKFFYSLTAASCHCGLSDMHDKLIVIVIFCSLKHGCTLCADR